MSDKQERSTASLVPLVYAPEILDACGGDPDAALYLAFLLECGRLEKFKRFCSGDA